MQYTTLGRTGLKVSVPGLGAGGGSRLGLARGKSHADAVALVRQAIDLGINVVDTARGYGTEDVVGDALQDGLRASVVLSTKHQISESGVNGRNFTADDVVSGLNESLRRLRTDHVDIFYLHAVTTARLDYALNEIIPAVLREKEKGKFRFLGVTEAPSIEIHHQGLVQALKLDLFDVVMVAFQMFQQNARETVFPRALEQGVGTMLMYAVRGIFANPGHLRRVVRQLADEGQLPKDLAMTDGPLDFLVHPGGATSVMDAAYRFACHEPGADVVLFGTGDAAHLRANVASILAPPLPEDDVAAIRKLFSHLAGVGLDLQ